GFDGVETRPAQDLLQVALDLAPCVLEALLGVELLAPQPRRDRRSDRRQRYVEGVGQRMGGVGREHDRPKAGVGAAQGRGSRRGRLADPALAGEQQDPRAVAPCRGHADSTCRFSSRRAVPMILPSARRLTKPGMGTMRSTSRWYVTSVPA